MSGEIILKPPFYFFEIALWNGQSSLYVDLVNGGQSRDWGSLLGFVELICHFSAKIGQSDLNFYSYAAPLPHFTFNCLCWSIVRNQGWHKYFYIFINFLKFTFLCLVLKCLTNVCFNSFIFDYKDYLNYLNYDNLWLLHLICILFLMRFRRKTKENGLCFWILVLLFAIDLRILRF